jgi:hypothetical protein
VKPVGADLAKLAATEQVVRYWTRYRLVLVTDLREFALLGEEGGTTVVRERYRLADTTADFWELARHPQKAATEQGERFEEFVQRVLLHAAPLVDPKDVAWFLASYARPFAASTRVRLFNARFRESLGQVIDHRANASGHEVATWH